MNATRRLSEERLSTLLRAAFWRRRGMKIMLSLSLFLGCRLSVGPPLERAAAAKSSLARFARLSIHHPKRVRRAGEIRDTALACAG